MRPGLDDKVLADWNGLMIAALVNAGIILDEPAWLRLARRAFDFIAGSMTRDDRLGHSFRAGKLLLPGLGSDYAAMIRAALALYEATGEPGLLDRALGWQHALRQPLRRCRDRRLLPFRRRCRRPAAAPAFDRSTTPSPISTRWRRGNLVRLAVLTGETAWRAQADRLIEGILAANGRNLFGHVALLNALDLRLRGAEIVATGPQAERFAQAALKLPFLDRIVLRAAAPADLPADHPAQEKLAAAPASAAFVCVGETCSLPVAEPGEIAAAVAAMRQSP